MTGPGLQGQRAVSDVPYDNPEVGEYNPKVVHGMNEEETLQINTTGYVAMDRGLSLSL